MLNTTLDISNENAFDQKLDVLVVAIPTQVEQSTAAVELDKRLGGKLSAWLKGGKISSEANKTSLWLAPANIAAESVLTVGLGEFDSVTPASLFRAAGSAIKQVAVSQTRHVGLAGFPLTQDESAGNDAVISAALISGIGQDLYRAKKSMFAPTAITIFTPAPLAIAAGQAIAEGIALTKSLVNQPANFIYPVSFVEQTLAAIAGGKLTSEVWDKEKLEAEKCDTLLAVARGSVKEPRLLILRYPGTKAGEKLSPIALVGKGVTFDSGGLSLKPSDSMLTMKCDMAGGATVVGAMLAIEKMQIDRPVIALIGLVENMISGDSYRLGDVLTSRSGKTIEIHNTDAEGRLVLADVLDVARSQSPSHIIDFATLTGACLVALGTDIGGIMANNKELEAQIITRADEVGEYVWPLPMYKLFDEQIQSKVADIKNVGEGRWGGAITAAKFLEQFVGDTPWAHIDLAGPAFFDKPKPWCDAGATGYMVHTMAHWLKSLGDKNL